MTNLFNINSEKGAFKDGHYGEIEEYVVTHDEDFIFNELSNAVESYKDTNDKVAEYIEETLDSYKKAVKFIQAVKKDFDEGKIKRAHGYQTTYDDVNTSSLKASVKRNAEAIKMDGGQILSLVNHINGIFTVSIVPGSPVLNNFLTRDDVIYESGLRTMKVKTFSSLISTIAKAQKDYARTQDPHLVKYDEMRQFMTDNDIQFIFCSDIYNGETLTNKQIDEAYDVYLKVKDLKNQLDDVIENSKINKKGWNN